MQAADMYNSLREWHFARLRNTAQIEAEQSATTPAGLTASDKESIPQLVEASLLEMSKESSQ